MRFPAFLILFSLVIQTVDADVVKTSNIIETSVPPVRIVWMSDSSGEFIKGESVLIEPFSGQVSVNNSANSVTMISNGKKKASILLDFGKEIYGGLKIYTGMARTQSPTHLRVCLGESVTEAMSDTDIPDNPQNPTNDHSLRDYNLEAPWLGSVECGKTGFRFARIDLLDTVQPFPLRYVEARSFIRDIPDVGSFHCSDPRLEDIWSTGAYTVKLNMQDFVWDGIKRDRLVWIGDMHPEVTTITTVWGNDNVVNRTLDYAKDDTPLPGWMNGHSSYSLWWLIIQRDLYLHTGDSAYINSQREYINGLVKQIDACVDENGCEHLDGTRFLDWPTSENIEAVHCGLQSLTKIAMEAVQDIARWTGDNEMMENATSCLSRLALTKTPLSENKQAAALNIISGNSTDPERESQVILKNGASGFSTFYGYYMLEALAATGHYDEAMKLISDYWGSMLDLGATTFWEDLNYNDVDSSGRIDEFVPAYKHDIHAQGGAYCYKGLRLSLCHGWASGPTPWLTRYVLGIRPLEPGCATIEINPNLGYLEYASGTVPTPKGVVKVSVVKDASGKPVADVQAPVGIKIINMSKGKVESY